MQKYIKSIYYGYMNTAVVNFKTDPKLKAEAQKLALQMGLSFSMVMNSLLRRFINERELRFTPVEEPSEWLINELKEAEKDEKYGRVSPTFDNIKDSLDWLHKESKKYANKI